MSDVVANPIGCEIVAAWRDGGRVLDSLADEQMMVADALDALVAERDRAVQDAELALAGIPDPMHPSMPKEWADGLVAAQILVAHIAGHDDPGNVEAARAALGEADRASVRNLSTTAWLVERGQPERQVPPVWRIAGPNPDYRDGEQWTTDAYEATRYATRKEAQAVVDRLFTGPSSRLPDNVTARATEHAWFALEEADRG